ncbi:N-acetyltransferase family protein [Paenibacillus sp. SI8]|uniref:GNAT family N-acetyltransferase n=1 Tax=unclassified Paenibacillus TaxID=185978 RepID=UPI0034657CB0
MNYTIRIAQAQDYEAVNAIVRVGQVEHAEALPTIFAELDRVVAMGWYRSFSDAVNKVILVAECEIGIVGVSMLELKKSAPYDALVPRTYAHLNELAVAPMSRSQGVGTKLYTASLQWAQERGASSLELNVWEFNERAIAFYESLGMSTLHRTMSIELLTSKGE